MSKKRSGNFIVRRVIDIAMTAVIIILLGFQVTGQMAHEWMGVTMFVLVILHTILNHAWYRGLFRGKYTAVRVLQTIVNLALLVCFVLTAVSGMMMSEHALPFLRRESLVGTAREMHLAFSHWSFVLVSAHLGLHWGMMMRPLQRKKVLWRVLSLAAVIAAGYGMLLSVRAQLWSYMSFQVQFVFYDYGKAPIQVFLENICMMASWAFIAYELVTILRKSGRNDPHRRWISLGMIAAEFVLAFLFSLIAG